MRRRTCYYSFSDQCPKNLLFLKKESLRSNEQNANFPSSLDPSHEKWKSQVEHFVRKFKTKVESLEELALLKTGCSLLG